jgi:hypothetical protein
MSLTIIILRELLRVYMIGLLIMLILSCAGVVSWAAVAAATSWWSVSLLPLVLGIYTDAFIYVADTTISALRWAVDRYKEARS